MTRKRQRGNGEGTEYPRKNKDGKVTSYRGSYWVQTARGPKRRYVSAKTKTEAQIQLRKELARLDEGLTFDAENLSLGEYLDRWLEDSMRGSIRKSTYDRYEGAVRVHIKPALGRLKLNKLAPAHLQSFYRNRLDAGCAPASVNKLHVVLHKALSQAVEWRMLPRNAAEAVRAPRPAPKEMQPLSTEETRRFLEAARGDRLEALYVLAVTTGMRQGEILALKWQDVDLENATLGVRRTLGRSGGRLLLGEPKTKKSRRTIHLTEAAVRALREHLSRQMEEIQWLGDLYKDDGLVFTSEVGTLINPSNLRRRSFARLLKRGELPLIRFHDLRHTCATLLFGRGVHPKYVQELLGHATIAITLDTYSHVIASMGDQTAKAMEDALSTNHCKVGSARRES
jgi:integrase